MDSSTRSRGRRLGAGFSSLATADQTSEFVHDVPREMEREVENCDQEQSEGSMDGEAGSLLLHHH